jgi:DNA-binding SARP family transcriptional activator
LPGAPSRAANSANCCGMFRNDPRGELRWCLSKVRGIVDDPRRRRVEARDDTIRLDLADCFVDAIEIARATQEGIETIAPERLRILAGMFAGDFAAGAYLWRCMTSKAGPMGIPVTC